MILPLTFLRSSSSSSRLRASSSSRLRASSSSRLRASSSSRLRASSSSRLRASSSSRLRASSSSRLRASSSSRLRASSSARLLLVGAPARRFVLELPSCLFPARVLFRLLPTCVVVGLTTSLKAACVLLRAPLSYFRPRPFLVRPRAGFLVACIPSDFALQDIAVVPGALAFLFLGAPAFRVPAGLLVRAPAAVVRARVLLDPPERLFSTTALFLLLAPLLLLASAPLFVVLWLLPPRKPLGRLCLAGVLLLAPPALVVAPRFLFPRPALVIACIPSDFALQDIAVVPGALAFLFLGAPAFRVPAGLLVRAPAAVVRARVLLDP